MTGEGKVKDFTKKLLISQGLLPAGKAALATPENTGWFHIPVSNGMGVSGISDLYGHYKGAYFTIETKVIGKDPTPLQAQQIKATRLTGAMAFVVRCEADLKEVVEWFDFIDSRENFLTCTD